MIALLPFHSLVITLLLAHAHLPLPMLRAVASWKELLVLATFIGVLAVAVTRKNLPRLVWVDWIVFAWAGQALLYFVFADLFFDRPSGLRARLYGLRDWMLYVVPYSIGRLVSISERDLTRVLRALLAIGAVTSVIGILEYLLVPTHWHIVLGVPRYFGEFLGLQYATTWGLPINYWQNVGEFRVRRAVSVYMSGQAFALPFLLLWPLALLNAHNRFTRGRVALIAVNATALLLTMTRMTIAVCFLQGLIVFWLLNRKDLQLVYLTLVAVAAGLLLMAPIAFRMEDPVSKPPDGGSTVTFHQQSARPMVRDTATLHDDSSRARPAQWAEGWSLLLKHPGGMGLGTTGETASRFGMGGMGNEAGYLKVTGALGLPGLLIFLGWFLGVLMVSLAAARSERDPWNALAVLTFATAVGFLINNLTAPPDQSLFLRYLFPWFAGMTVRRSVQSGPSQPAT
jgi:hypothetical protein